MSRVPTSGVLIVDGLYMAGITRAKSQPTHQAITVDYDCLARAFLLRAGIACDEGRYYVHRTPTIDPKFPDDPQMRTRVAKDHGFLTALQRQKGFEVVTAPAPWRTNDCGGRTTDDRQVPGALMALMARLLTDRLDILHYVLVAASPAYIPMVAWVRSRGVYVTLFHMTACDELRHAVDCAIGLRVAELSRF